MILRPHTKQNKRKYILFCVVLVLCCIVKREGEKPENLKEMLKKLCVFFSRTSLIFN